MARKKKIEEPNVPPHRPIDDFFPQDDEEVTAKTSSDDTSPADDEEVTAKTTNDVASLQNDKKFEAKPYNDVAIAELDVELIEVDPSQPRKHFDEDYIKSLANSIRSNGLIQNIAVRKNGDAYIVVDGECRLRAWKLLNKEHPHAYDKIPALIVHALDNITAKRLSLLANVYREDLLPIERAEAIQEYKKTYNLKQESLARSLHIDQSTISKILSLNKLDSSIKEIIRHSKQYSLRELVKISKIKNSNSQKIAFNKLQKRRGITEADFGATTTTDDASDITDDRKTKLLFARLAGDIKALSKTEDKDFNAYKPQIAMAVMSAIVCLEKMARVSDDFSLDLNQEISLERLKEKLMTYIPADAEQAEEQGQTDEQEQKDEREQADEQE